MSAERYVATRAVQQAVARHETDVLKALRIPWQDGSRHVRCAYREHSDEHPSWRWDGRKARALRTCITRPGGHSIFDVAMQVERIEFEAAKLRVAEILERHDLIKERSGEQHQATGEADCSYRAVARAPARSVSHFFVDRRS